ncbi:MAG: Maf family protein, partial [Lentilitoribacter sp.]
MTEIGGFPQMGGISGISSKFFPRGSSRVIHMPTDLILASGSDIRRQLLENAGLTFTVQKARIDEEAIKASLLYEEANPRDIADALAEYKARRVAQKCPGSVVIGCDQVLECTGEVFSK